MKKFPPVEGHNTGITAEFIALYRRAFDAEPRARYCICEVDGITLLLAVGETGALVQTFAREKLGAEIQRKFPKAARS